MTRLAIRMPKMSMTMTEGEVATWLVQVGDEVAIGDVVCEVMTDKVDMEVESTVAGTLVEISVESGMAEVGAPIGWVEGEDDGGGFGDLITGPEPVPAEAPVEEAPPAPVPVEEAPVAPTEAPAPPAEQALVPAAVPRARALAREHGLDVGAIAGTGRDGLVTMADVEGRVAPAASATPSGVTPDRRAVIRGIVARTMEPSALIPQFTVWRDLELDAADRHRNGLSWTTVLLRAYASSLRRVPELLSRWEDGRPVDSGPPTIAVAVATDRGLLVPVFADPDLGAAADLDAEMRQVVVEAQRGRVGPAHLGVANGSLSNLGGLGVDRFQALLTPPQASVLSVGAVKRRPVAVPGGIGLALTVTVGLTVDHRVADGVHAAQVLSECQEFLRKLADGS